MAEPQPHPILASIVEDYEKRGSIGLVYGVRLDEMTRAELIAIAAMGWNRLEELIELSRPAASFPQYPRARVNPSRWNDGSW
jgi:hypothetical protein